MYVLCRMWDKTRHTIMYASSPQFFSALENLFSFYSQLSFTPPAMDPIPSAFLARPLKIVVIGAGYVHIYWTWVKLSLNRLLQYFGNSICTWCDHFVIKCRSRNIWQKSFLGGYMVWESVSRVCTTDFREIYCQISSSLMLIDAHVMCLPTPISPIGRPIPHGHRFILQLPRFTNTSRM